MANMKIRRLAIYGVVTRKDSSIIFLGAPTKKEEDAQVHRFEA